MSIATTPEIDGLLARGAPVAVGVSGGKDSQAAALAIFGHLENISYTGPRLLIHSDLGTVEWAASLPACESLARHLGVELAVVRRPAGDLMDRWEARWRSSVKRYTELSTVTLVLPWSTPAMRFCTSELKTHLIAAELRRRFKGKVFINATGVRRSESKARALVPISNPEGDGRAYAWRPIAAWSIADVFQCIAEHGLQPHEAYGRGMSRVSCRFCIMSNANDLMTAAAAEESAPLYRRMVALEIVSTFGFQGSRWLGDVAPHLLTDSDRAALLDAKERAAQRIAAERRITKPMLYQKGWPVRMLTDPEAELLASVRREVCRIMSFEPTFVDAASIHSRYAELLARRPT